MVFTNNLLLMSLWSICGALLAAYLGRPFGPIGIIIAFLLGVTGAFYLTVLILVKRAKYFYPLPICRQGMCQGFDYHYPAGTFYGLLYGVYYYRCKCGDYYARIGKRFMEVLPNGERRPYKKLTRFREWGDDKRGCGVPGNRD